MFRVLSLLLITFSLLVSTGVRAATPSKPEMTAVDLFTGARTAMTQSDPQTAILYLNTLLNMPQNEYTQEAQELIGMAREDARQTDKARAEYESYLRMYPSGVNADRVRGRLAGLDKNVPVDGKPAEAKKKPIREIRQATTNASVSQYYYGGATQSPDGSKVDVSTLITNVEASERYKFYEWDTKLVFRDTQIHNMRSGSADRNNVQSFYLEQTNIDKDYMWRVGRQTSVGQGVLGRFDGATGKYRISDDFRLTGVIGVPDEGSHHSTKTDRHFYGTGIELNNANYQWSGNAYIMQQVADGLVERRSIGGEARYFNGDTFWLASLDYDTIYNQTTLAMLQGSVTVGSYTFNTLLDHRNSTILGAEYAISSVVGALSVSDLRQRLSSGEIYNLVKSVVPQTDTAMFGITKDFGEYWKLSGDIRALYIGPTDGNLVIAPQAEMKDNYTFTFQAVGSGIIWGNDTFILMSSHVQDPRYTANNVSVTHSLLLDQWHLSNTVRYYEENQGNGLGSTSVNPVVRLQYQLETNMSVEAELNVNRTVSNDGYTTWREMLFFGYRWDLR